MRWLVAFGAFWYDFIVGDSAVLAVGGVGVLAGAFLLAHTGMDVVSQFFLPIATVGTLALSLPRRLGG